MPNLRCTQKLLKAIGIHRTLQREETRPAILGDWYANLLRMSHQRALLFTNEPTLYSFAVLDVRKVSLTHLAVVFLDHLKLNLAHEDMPAYVIEQVLADYQRVGLVGTASRSVLGSMNDLASLLEHYVCDAGGVTACNVRKLNAQLNRIPHRPLGWKFAIEVLQERLLGAFSVPGPQPSRVFLN